jgi:MFS family permease
VNPLRAYLLGTGSWFLGFGIQSVTFAWLVTMVLNASPAMVGVAQMALLAPMLVLVLIGGGLADFLGGRRVALVAQTLAGVPPLLLALVIWQGQLSFAAMVVYGIAMGSLSAFLTPARDGLLNEVAPGTVQQAVQLATMVQFIGQMIGIFIAAFADSWGAVSMLTIQGTIFLLGVLGFARIPQPDVAPVRRHTSMLMELRVSIVAGYRVVADDQATRTTVLQNIAMSLFFMGAFIVTIPLLVREYYGGDSTELAWTNGAFSLGLVILVALLTRVADLTRPGRALILAQAAGAIVLAAVGLGVPFPVFVALILTWGVCGGVAMTMSRTIVQERAPTDSRARVMSFYALSLMGAAPIGALLNGFMAGWIGPRYTLALAGGLMFLAMGVVAVTSKLWGLRSHTARV